MLGGGAFGRQSPREWSQGPDEGDPRGALPLCLPCGNIRSRQPTTSPPQMPIVLAPRFQISSLQSWELEAPQSRELGYTRPSGRRPEHWRESLGTEGGREFPGASPSPCSRLACLWGQTRRVARQLLPSDHAVTDEGPKARTWGKAEKGGSSLGLCMTPSHAAVASAESAALWDAAACARYARRDAPAVPPCLERPFFSFILKTASCFLRPDWRAPFLSFPSPPSPYPDHRPECPPNHSTSFGPLSRCLYHSDL